MDGWLQTPAAGMNGETAATPAPTAAPSGTTDYILCGWRVRSVVPLPEAMPWTGDDRSPDVTIRFGPVPVLLDPLGKGGPAQVGPDGACRFEFEGIGRFLVLAGREV